MQKIEYSNQALRDMEQASSSKSGKELVQIVYCTVTNLTYTPILTYVYSIHISMLTNNANPMQIN